MQTTAADSQPFLNPGNGARLMARPDAIAKGSDPLIREQLARILRSPIFASSIRLKRFLRFVVETTLAGRAEYLKEYVIGTEVYDRKPPYEPSQDSIVRTEARRLKNKLKEYYDTLGAADPVLIGFRAGSYVPVFTHCELMYASGPRKDRQLANAAAELPEIFIAVTPFEEVAGDALARDYAHAIAESLAHQLMMMDGCRIVDAESGKHPGSAEQERSRVCPDLVFHGSVARSNKCIRVTSRLADPNGFQLWSMQFDLQADRAHLFGITNQIVSALRSRTRVQHLCSRGSTPEERSARNSINSAILTAENLMEVDSRTDCQSIQARFEIALRSAPHQGRAHAGVAHCLVEQALSGVPGSRKLVLQAKSAILRALEHDSRLSSAYACLGVVLALEHDVASAQKAFDRCCAIGPEAAGHSQYALVLAAQSRFEDAWHHLTKAQSIDPFSSRQQVARLRTLYLSRRFEELIQNHGGSQVCGLQPAESRIFEALSCLELGMYEEARQLAHRMRRDTPAHPQLMAAAAEILARGGDAQSAMEIAEHFRLFSKESPISSFRQCALALALRDSEGAIGALVDSYENSEAELIWFRLDPRFDLIREAPRVRSLDVWGFAGRSKDIYSEAQALLPRLSSFDRFAKQPRVA